MSVLGSIKAFFSALGAFFNWLGDKQLLDAGEARGDAKRNKKVVENVEKANRAARDSDNRERVRKRYSRD